MLSFCSVSNYRTAIRIEKRKICCYSYIVMPWKCKNYEITKLSLDHLKKSSCTAVYMHSWLWVWKRERDGMGCLKWGEPSFACSAISKLYLKIKIVRRCRSRTYNKDMCMHACMLLYLEELLVSPFSTCFGGLYKVLRTSVLVNTHSSPMHASACGTNHSFWSSNPN